MIPHHPKPPAHQPSAPRADATPSAVPGLPEGATAMGVGGAVAVPMEEDSLDLLKGLGNDCPDLILEPGSKLYHGTLEPLSGAMQPGGYDRCFWTTDFRSIARSYIPPCGGQTLMSISSLMKPPRQGDTKGDLQRQLGIEFMDIEYENYSPRRFNYPAITETMMADTPWPKRDDFSEPTAYYAATHEWSKERDRRFQSFVQERLEALGYKPHGDGPSWDPTYWLYVKHVNGVETLLPNEYQVGTLLEFTPGRPLRIYDMTDGGRIEGDLTDLDYHRTRTFRELAEQGYDGVKINDFAQVAEAKGERRTNIGHTSIGIFGHAMADLVEVQRVASTHPKDFWKEVAREKFEKAAERINQAEPAS